MKPGCKFPRCECHNRDHPCTCAQMSTYLSLFLENICDVAEALAHVMMICGIHGCKARASTDIIVNAFLHYDEVRHRINPEPRKHLTRDEFVHDLGRHCLMSRMEAILSYAICKRAFKAFFHGTCEGEIRNPILDAQRILSQQPMWEHAAKHTAQIFAKYESFFFVAQKNYEAKIKCIYRNLYERLKARASPLKVDVCTCTGCTKRLSIPDGVPLVSSTGSLLKHAHLRSHSKEVGPFKEPSTESLAINEQVLPHCDKCGCPRVICDCDVDPETGVLGANYSQGPYTCHWIRDDDDEEEPDPCIPIPYLHQCPVDCIDDDDFPCGPECICHCGPFCQCGLYDFSEAEPPHENIIEENTIAKDAPVPYELIRRDERDRDIKFDGCRVVHENPETFIKLSDRMEELEAKKRLARMDAREAAAKKAAEEWFNRTLIPKPLLSEESAETSKTELPAPQSPTTKARPRPKTSLAKKCVIVCQCDRESSNIPDNSPSKKYRPAAKARTSKSKSAKKLNFAAGSFKTSSAKKADPRAPSFSYFKSFNRRADATKQPGPV